MRRKKFVTWKNNWTTSFSLSPFMTLLIQNVFRGKSQPFLHLKQVYTSVFVKTIIMKIVYQFAVITNDNFLPIIQHLAIGMLGQCSQLTKKYHF